MTDHKPRVIIYGTGNHGQEAAIIAHGLGWNIIGAYNRDGEKIGKDIGEIRGGTAPIGVIIEDCEKTDFKALDADIAIVAMTDRLEQNFAGYEKLLGAGINIVCHGSEAYFPQHTNPAIAEKIDKLATANGVTFTGTGVWDHSRIWAGILAAGPCNKVTRLLHKSKTLIHTNPYVALVGTGISVEEFERDFAQKPGPLGGIYQTIPAAVMHGLGFTLSKVTEHREPVVFDHPIYCEGLERDVLAGEVAGLRVVVEVSTQEGPSARAEIELRLLNEDEETDMAWQIEGEPNSDILLTRHDSLRTSTMCLINRVPDVLAAPAGIQLITQMGPLKMRAATNL